MGQSYDLTDETFLRGIKSDTFITRMISKQNHLHTLSYAPFIFIAHGSSTGDRQLRPANGDLDHALTATLTLTFSTVIPNLAGGARERSRQRHSGGLQGQLQLLDIDFDGGGATGLNGDKLPVISMWWRTELQIRRGGRS